MFQVCFDHVMDDSSICEIQHENSEYQMMKSFSPTSFRF